MEVLVVTIAVVSGLLLLACIFALLTYSGGVAKSEVARAKAVVNPVRSGVASPGIVYWVNVIYLGLIMHFKWLLATSCATFSMAVAILLMRG
jgi:hypothetical protein